MSEPNQNRILYLNSRRLLQLRMPLALFLVLNLLLVCAVPFSQSFGKATQGGALNSAGDAKNAVETDTIAAIDPDSKNSADLVTKTTDSKASDQPNKSAPKIEDDLISNPDSGSVEVSVEDLEKILGPNQDAENGGVDFKDLGIDHTTLASAESQPLDPVFAENIQDSIRIGMSHFTAAYVRGLDDMLVVRESTPSELVSTESKVGPERLVIHHSNRWDVEIHYMIDGQERTIFPGESHELGTNQVAKLIEFHRGGEFDDVVYEITHGRYDFRISTEGWELVQANDTENVVHEQIP